MKFKNTIKCNCIKFSVISGAIFISFSMLSACKKFVQVDIPTDRITGYVTFQDVATADAALANIYIKLRENVLVTGRSTGLSSLLSIYADEAVFTAAFPDFMQFYQNALLPSNTYIISTWNDSYNLIFAANAILEGTEQSTNISIENKNRIKGEALFLRAYIHFYLLNLYGSIPYITTTDYQLNTTVHKMSNEVVYAAIITDLKQSKTLISDAYPTAERVRPNRSVVSAMLARVYLYTQNWADAEIEATAVIGNSLYSWVGNIDNVFLKGSTGTIWQLMPASPGLNTNEAQTFIFLSGPPASRALSNNFYNSFESGDLRQTHWIGTVISGTNKWYYPYKYKLNSSTGTVSQEYSILFRLEEQYLIRAEARANQNNIGGAVEDLNKIRARARAAVTIAVPNPLPDYPSTIGKEDCLIAVLHERQVELFTELGHRFFDLKRTGRANAVLAAVKQNWTATDILWPLPEKELLLNPNLKPQNVGY